MWIGSRSQLVRSTVRGSQSRPHLAPLSASAISSAALREQRERLPRAGDRVASPACRPSAPACSRRFEEAAPFALAMLRAEIGGGQPAPTCARQARRRAASLRRHSACPTAAQARVGERQGWRSGVLAERRRDRRRSAARGAAIRDRAGDRRWPLRSAAARGQRAQEQAIRRRGRRQIERRRTGDRAGMIARRWRSAAPRAGSSAPPGAGVGNAEGEHVIAPVVAQRRRLGK